MYWRENCNDKTACVVYWRQCNEKTQRVWCTEENRVMTIHSVCGVLKRTV
jgi:hypothetical protein